MQVHENACKNKPNIGSYCLGNAPSIETTGQIPNSLENNIIRYELVLIRRSNDLTCPICGERRDLQRRRKFNNQDTVFIHGSDGIQNGHPQPVADVDRRHVTERKLGHRWEMLYTHLEHHPTRTYPYAIITVRA